MQVFKKISRFVCIALLLLIQVRCSETTHTIHKTGVLPIPLSQIHNEGFYTLDNSTQLIFDSSFQQVADFLKTYIEQGSNIKLNTATSTNSISFVKNTQILNPEGYELSISTDKITITASAPAGAFYAVQTLRQLLPIQFENGSYKNKEAKLQNMTIKDAPRFKYRGMHLDVGRHFFSVAFIKKYLDMMSLLKMNTFHWHLTEDQGWRIEIKKYPKLHEVAAFRKETLMGHYSDQPQKYDGKEYGGYYTQEEVKEIVAYAAARQIDVIPEIEMPGHSAAAISAYPELGCTGEQIEVATKWGVYDDIYCPKESTFKFLEDVLDEIITLFPSKYIHIGGDEAPKVRWKNSKFCQRLIAEKNLKDENGLQSYFIKRIETYLNTKGKQIIGWDEILDGGLAPNATVMSWRGIKGAVAAAKEQHDVILTPNSHCYFDHYQSTNENEPLAWGGYLPLEKVYGFNPIPKELTENEAAYVLGAQGNVWTEYMQTEKQVEYMAFPRMIALSEVVWSEAVNKNYNSFKKRLIEYQKRLDLLDVNYANHLYEVSGQLYTTNKSRTYILEAASEDASIRYTLDGTLPNSESQRYKSPIKIQKTSTIKAASFSKTKRISSIFSEKISTHKAVGKQIKLSVAPSLKYNAGGVQALVNGISGHNKRFGDKEWLGFEGQDVGIQIDLEEKTTISSISMRFHNGKGQWIYAPKEIRISATLENGNVLKHVEKIKNSDSLLVHCDIQLLQAFQKKQSLHAKSLDIEVINYGIIPDGVQGAGHKPWLFIDEIIVE